MTKCAILILPALLTGCSHVSELQTAYEQWQEAQKPEPVEEPEPEPIPEPTPEPEPIPEPQPVVEYRNMHGSQPPNPMPVRTVDGVLNLLWEYADIVTAVRLYKDQDSAVPLQTLHAVEGGWAHTQQIKAGMYIGLTIHEHFDETSGRVSTCQCAISLQN